ncbi:3-hydroxyisobutyrate dehydrogenase [Temperatibacter marinus]|uniref:3-hydroxyisobutyrate dehydrogenase n=1 Tax=Temperatibacter marinus TaxID=1456591 RepID=A0AA52H9B0_9PROT|nr:3-hydroxyisobutyrate dehydrogenase [Temperatibacter marinus]WND01505.1 3-hydroxyisobutyrate dehydrogenase [Temperatibacter marinus]
MTQTIGFIGLGNMGLPMAKNLLKEGFAVRGFDLSDEARNGLEVAGGSAFTSVAEAVTNVDAVVTMLPNGAIVKNVYLGKEGILASIDEKTLLIDSSTIDVQSARDVIAAADERNIQMIDAPVSGGVGGAAAGTLAFMVGGKKEAFTRAEAILAPMAGKIVHAGGPGNGQAAKICNNMLLAITMIGTGEAFNLGRALGVEDQVLYDIMSNASGQSWSLTSYCPVPGPVPTSPANNAYQPGFATDLMLKDLGLAVEAIETAGTETPLGKHSHDLYKAMAADGNGGVDFSGMISYLADQQS